MVCAAEFKRLLKVAEDAARHASRAIRKEIPIIRKIESDSGHDVKILADRKLESLIVSSLRRNSAFPILSEESGLIYSKKGVNDYRWIIDPLDGSLNFSRDIPFYAISIAFWRQMEPIFGVVYDFNHCETFTGLVNEGAWLNGKEIKVSKVGRKSKAILCTGFPVGSVFSEKHLSNFIKDLVAFKKVRLFGSAALSLAYVACGRADFYKEHDIKIWDIAAGFALIKAAGGEFKLLPSKEKNTFTVSASNKVLKI